MCGCECCISAKIMHSSLLSWCDSYLNKLKDISQNDQNRRSRETENSHIWTFKIQSCHMGVIFNPKNMKWQMQQCVITNSLIMRYHTGNVYWDFVPNVQALIFLTRKHMIIIPIPVLQFVFIFIIWLRVVKTWQASVIRQEKLSRVSKGYFFRTINKDIY